MQVSFIHPAVMRLAIIDAVNQVKMFNEDHAKNLVASVGQPTTTEPRTSVVLLQAEGRVPRAVIYFKDRDDRDDRKPDYEVQVIKYEGGSPFTRN